MKFSWYRVLASRTGSRGLDPRPTKTLVLVDSMLYDRYLGVRSKTSLLTRNRDELSR